MNTDTLSAVPLGAGVVKRPTHLADGRELIYFDDPDTTLGAERAIDARTLDPRPMTATMRQDVLTGDWITHVVGIAHGWLYMIYVLVTLLLSLRQRWSITMTVLVALAGTIPFAVFFAEHRVVAMANAKAAAPEGATAQA